jgi:hypothetical protein
MRPAGKATKEDRPGASFSPFPSQEDMTAPAFDDEFNAPALDKGSGDINAGATDHDHDGEDEDSWRKLGRQFRSNLMRLDAKNAFQLKSECSIERYYQVADRVRALLRIRRFEFVPFPYPFSCLCRCWR